jgi:hypothetical protein
MSNPDVRYSAEWISKQHCDESGEWEPDRDEYACSSHETFESAKADAIASSKAANCVEWWRVCEERFDASLGIPRRSAAAWDTTRTWSGDWQGNCDEDRGY